MEEHRLKVLDNGVLRRILGLTRDKETQECKNLHNDELKELHSSPNIIWVIKSRRMR
jgi:hypothetical protein